MKATEERSWRPLLMERRWCGMIGHDEVVRGSEGSAERRALPLRLLAEGLADMPGGFLRMAEMKRERSARAAPARH